jgi:hypothetical protein
VSAISIQHLCKAFEQHCAALLITTIYTDNIYIHKLHEQIVQELRSAGADWGDQVQVGAVTIELQKTELLGGGHVSHAVSNSSSNDSSDSSSAVDSDHTLTVTDGKHMQKGANQKAAQQRLKSAAQ